METISEFFKMLERGFFDYYSSPIHGIAEQVKELGLINDEMIYYPKLLFSSKTTIGLYLFHENFISVHEVVEGAKKKSLTVRTYPINRIKAIELLQEGYFTDSAVYRLKVVLEDAVIELNPKVDANKRWRKNFSDQVVLIYKHLIR